MAKYTVFNEEAWPGFMSVPLKGKMLLEFLSLLRDGVKRREALTHDKSVLNNPESKRVQDAASRLYRELDQRFGHEGAMYFGVDGNDVFAAIERISGEAYQGEPMEEIEQQMRLQSRGRKMHNVDAYLQSMYVQTLHLFSLCLAVQEGKEPLLLEIHAQEEEAEKKRLAALKYIEAPNGESLHQRVVQTAIGIVTRKLGLHFSWQRGSLCHTLSQALAFGADYERGVKGGEYSILDHGLELLMNVDGSTHAGQAKIERTREDLFRQLHEKLGVGAPAR